LSVPTALLIGCASYDVLGQGWLGAAVAAVVTLLSWAVSLEYANRNLDFWYESAAFAFMVSSRPAESSDRA